MSTPRVPRRTLVGRSAHAPTSAAAGWPRLPRPAQSNWVSETAKPGQEGSGEVACGMCTETYSPPRVAAFGTAACWTVAWQRRCLDGPIGAHQAAVVSGCKRVPPARPPWAVLCSVVAVGVVSRNHQRRRAEWGCTSVATAAASACGGKTSRPIHRTIAWGRVAGRVAGGGLGLRGAPRPGRPALSAQASAGRPARRPCG